MLTQLCRQDSPIAETVEFAAIGEQGSIIHSLFEGLMHIVFAMLSSPIFVKVKGGEIQDDVVNFS